MKTRPRETCPRGIGERGWGTQGFTNLLYRYAAVLEVEGMGGN